MARWPIARALSSKGYSIGLGLGLGLTQKEKGWWLNMEVVASPFSLSETELLVSIFTSM